MTARKSATKPKPKAKAKAKRKPAASARMNTAEGLGAETVSEEPKLTLKMEKFAQAYAVNGGNASAAYRTAYDAENMQPETIHVRACEMLKHGKVAVRLDQLRADALRRHQVTVDRVVAEYSKLAFANMTDYMRVNADGLAEVDLSKLNGDQAAAITEIRADRVRTIGGGEDGEPKAYVERVTFKLADKRSALDSLSKCLGMFVERHELTGKDGKDLMPEASSRDLARAVVAIPRDAQFEDQPHAIDGELAEDPEPSPADDTEPAQDDAPRVRTFNPATGCLE